MTARPPSRPARSRIRTAALAAPVAAVVLALAGCARAPDAPPAAPEPAVAAAPRPEPQPESVRLAALRRDRAERARDAQAAAARPPSAASQTMADYLAGIEETLLARGLMRTDSGDRDGPLTADRLTEDFIAIALRDEYSRNGGGALVPHSHAAPLRRFQSPVRIHAEFGDSVDAATRIRDRATIAGYAARLARATRHPVSLAGAGGNFLVLVVNEDERRAIGPRLARLVPGIPDPDLRAIRDLAPQNFCTVFAYSRGDSAAYVNAVAVIRAELPPRLRQSCFHEELAQGLGLANDSPAARPSIFNDDEEFALLTRHDELLLQMLYDPRLRPGMTEAEARPIAARIAAELVGGTS